MRRGDVIFELVPLQQSERDVREEAERAVREADARLTQTTQRAQRLEQLLKEGSASARSVEEAQADRAVAAAAAEAARKRLESVSRLPVGPRGEMALTAPFDGFITELRAAGRADDRRRRARRRHRADRRRSGSARPSTSAISRRSIRRSRRWSRRSARKPPGRGAPARRVTGPPAANRERGQRRSVLRVCLATRRLAMRPGERLAVRLPLKSVERALVVPQSAVVYDVNGGTWVYEQRAPHQFARRRVELGGPAGANVIVARGLTDGMTIVTVGAAELYGTEFYVSK